MTARSLALAVRPRGPYGLEVPVRDLAVPVGGTVTVPVKVRRHWSDFKGPVQLTRVSGPAQTNGQLINIPNTTINAPKDQAEVKFTVPANTAAGAYNLVLQGTGTLSFARESTPNARKQNIQVRTVTPAVASGALPEDGSVALSDGRCASFTGLRHPFAGILCWCRIRIHGLLGK